MSLVNFTRNSAATYFDRDGTMKIASDNEMRYEYDPATGHFMGLLIENTSTNLISRSTNMLVSPWNPARMGRELGPIRRGMQFFKLTPSTDSLVSHQITNAATFTAVATDAVVSSSLYIYQEGNDTTRVSLRCYDSIGFITYLYYDLPTVRALGGNDTRFGTITHIGDNIFKITATFPIRAGATSTGVQIYAAAPNANSTTSWNFNGVDSYFVSSPQLEWDAPSSFIPTGASAVTRAAENFILPLTDLGVDLAQGTIVADFFTDSSVPLSASYNIGISAETTATPGFIGIRRTATFDQCQYNLPTVTNNRAVYTLPQKVAMTWDSAGLRSARNGGELLSSTGAFTSSSFMTVLRLGSLTTAVGFRIPRVYIKSMTYGATSVSDARLLELSSV